jgi:hypothetical protein
VVTIARDESEMMVEGSGADKDVRVTDDLAPAPQVLMESFLLHVHPAHPHILVLLARYVRHMYRPPMYAK